MQRASLEQLFDSFRTTGDADALGAVFDATAPKLLLLAAHLTGDGGAAEDVVQATFLRAMQSAAEFDARRPLWPWLVGILANAARMERRRRGRRVDPERIAAVPASNDPSATAAAEETVEQVARAIDAMPEPFRAVLALRLVHGLSHPQIARALGIPVATARTRLHRGLAQLREALPAGLAATVALCAGERGLAAVRGVVMEHAAGGASATLAAASRVAARAFPFSRAGATALLVVMAVAAAALVTAWGMREPPAAQTARASTGSGAGASTARDVAPSPASPRRAMAAEIPETAWVLRGRITGPDASGARVRARATRGQVVTELGEASADAEGCYRIDVGALRGWTSLQRASAGVTIVVTAEGMKPVEARMEVELPLSSTGAHVFELDARLATPGFSISGRVVDVARQPVAGVVVCLGCDDPARDQRAETDRDGRWELWPGAPGEYTIRAFSVREGFASVEIAWAADRSLQLGDLVLATPSLLEGRIVMKDGTPVPDEVFAIRREDEPAIANGAELTSSPAIGTRPPGTVAATSSTTRPPSFPDPQCAMRQVLATTDHEGTFRIVVLDPGRYVLSVGDGILAPKQEFAVETGHAPYELALDGQLITVHVQESSGEPLPAATVSGMAWTADRAPAAAVIAHAARQGPSLREIESSKGFFGYARGVDARYSELAPWGSVWLFSTSLRGGFPTELVWTAQPGVASAHVQLTLRAVEAGGWLAPSIVDETGEPVEDYEVWVHMPVSGAAVEMWRRASFDAHQVEQLAPGRYRLTVKSGRRIANVWQNEAVETWADVRAGETTPVRIEVRRGGFVRLSLIGAAPGATEWRGVHFEEPGVRRHTGHAVEHPDGGASWFSEGTISVGAPLLLDKPFAAGMHTIRVYAEGYRPSTVDVRVEPGQIADVDVVMTPE